MRRFLVLAASIGILLASCVYENNEVYVDPVKPEDTSDAAIQLNGVSGTITITEPTTFYFKVFPAGKGEYYASIYAGHQTISDLYSETGEFYFTVRPVLTGNGEHTMRITAIYQSHSGSLASQLNIEGNSITAGWKIIVDAPDEEGGEANPSPLAAPTVYVEDGKSMVAWPQPINYNFDEFIVVRTYYGVNDVVLQRDSIKVADTHSVLLHDDSYVGGDVGYQVDLKKKSFYAKGKEKRFSMQPLTAALNSETNPVGITWRSWLYNNNLIVTLLDRSYPVLEEQTASFNIPFGTSETLNFKVYPNKSSPSPTEHFFQYERKVYQGKSAFPFQSISYLPAENFFLAIQNGAVKKINPTTFLAVASTNIPFSFNNILSSANGTRFVILDKATLQTLDASTLVTSTTINVAAIAGSSFSDFEHAPVLSDENILTGNFPDKSFAINLKTRQLIWSRDDAGVTTISADGKYIYWKGSVLEKEGTSWNNEIGKIPNYETAVSVQFRQGDHNQLIVAYADETSIYSLDGGLDGNGYFQLANSLTYPVTYDHLSQHYLRINPPENFKSQVFIYDAETFNELKHVESIDGRVFLINGQLFHSNGYCFRE